MQKQYEARSKELQAKVGELVLQNDALTNMERLIASDGMK